MHPLSKSQLLNRYNFQIGFMCYSTIYFAETFSWIHLVYGLISWYFSKNAGVCFPRIRCDGQEVTDSLLCFLSLIPGIYSNIQWSMSPSVQLPRWTVDNRRYSTDDCWENAVQIVLQCFAANQISMFIPQHNIRVIKKEVHNGQTVTANCGSDFLHDNVVLTHAGHSMSRGDIFQSMITWLVKLYEASWTISTVCYRLLYISNKCIDRRLSTRHCCVDIGSTFHESSRHSSVTSFINDALIENALQFYILTILYYISILPHDQTRSHTIYKQWQLNNI